MKLTLHIWRQKNASAAGTDGCSTPLTATEHMSFLEMLDVLNEELDREGRRAGRLRSRLPRRNLRLVRIHDQRHRARSAARQRRSASFTCGTSRMATCCISNRGARRRFPWFRDLVVDRSAFDRIIASGGFVSVSDRQRAGRQRHSRSQKECRSGHGCGGLHRMRRLCRRLPECRGGAVHRRQDQSSRPPAPGTAGARSSAL